MSEGKKDKRKGKVKEGSVRYNMVDERYEIIGGVRYDFLASPKYVHQRILGQLYVAFHSACAADGIILLAPMDVHFDADNILQPDVIYIARENRGIIRDGFVYGVPDLVVEILSEGTARNDKTIKKETYEKFGVKEYWLVDPVHKLVDQFVLLDGDGDGAYRWVATLAEGDRLVSATVPCLAVDLAAVFADD